MSETRRRPSPVALAILTVVIAMVSIQVGASIAKRLFPAVGATGATALRLFFATLILGLIWRPWRGKLTRRELLAVVTYGASLGGMNLLFYLALARIPLGIAVAIEFTGPLAVALFASRKPLDFVWAALAVCGIVLILPISGASKALDWVGVGFALGAGLCWALYILFGQKAGAAVHGGKATALGMATAALIACPIGIAHAGTALLDPAILPFAIGVAILSSALPYSLEMMALQRIPTRTFGILMSLEPAIGALSGLLFLHEQLALGQWVAIGCIILASVGSSASAQEKVATPEVNP